MASSTNPINYPPFYWDLIAQFNLTETKIEFTFDEKKTAHHMQIQFHAFIRALEREAEKLRKLNNKEVAMQREAEARLARTRKASVKESDGAWLLSFTHRDDDPTIQIMRRRLNEIQAEIDAKRPAPEIATAIPSIFAPSEGEEYDLASLLRKDEE